MSAVAFVLGCVLAVDAPTIVVDVDALALPQAQTEQLHGELMTRMVESGHAVGNAGAITVRLTGGGRRVHVEVQHGKRSWRRDVDGEGALLRLATIHAALDLLGEVDVVVDPDPALASTPARSVTVEADADAAAWVPEVIAALVDAGNVVKPSADGARWKVCVGAVEARPTIAVAPIDAPCPAGVASENVASDLAVALADARAPATVDRGAVSEPVAKEEPRAPVVERAAPPEARAIAPRPRGWSGALGIGLGAQARFNAEPLVLVHGDARHASGAMLSVRTELAPSVDHGLSVVDTFLTAGAGYAFVPRPTLRLELLATAGVLVHGYAYQGHPGPPHVDFTASVPLTLAIRLSPRVELGITALAGASGRPRRHLVAGTEIWHREIWRFAGLLSVRILLGRKPASAKMVGGS